MIYTCPHCHKQHRLPAGVMPPPNAATHCKQCGKRFLLETDRATEPTHTPSDKDEHVMPYLSLAATSAIFDTFPELLDLPPGKFPLNELFLNISDKEPPIKQQRLIARILKSTSPLLNDKILQKSEQVYRIATGIAYFPFEIPYANGLLTGPMNNYALLATNQRLIFINLDYHFTHPTRYIFQVPYANITRVSRGFYGSSLIVTSDSGRTWDFTTVERRLATSMEKFIRKQIELLGNSDSASPAPVQLCPVCFLPVGVALKSCPNCFTNYKSVAIARKKSLIAPGTGNLYLGNMPLGIIEIVGYLLTWIMTIVLVIIGIPGGILGGGLLVATYHGIAAYMAGKMAKKGYIATNSISTHLSLG